MSTQHDLTRYLPNLTLHRLGPQQDAGLWITSLPWPRAAAAKLELDEHPTTTVPLGQWYDAPGPQPRRLLLISDGGPANAEAPEKLSITTAAVENEASGSALPPAASMERFEVSPDEGLMWERHLLRLNYGERTLGIALGLRTGDEVHWWEACSLVVLEQTPTCTTIEMGGTIPHRQMTFEEFQSYKGYTNPYLHWHNWLHGRIFARLHANGVCEIYAHHINNKFFDDGRDLADAVPVIGFQTPAGDAELEALCGAWDGSRETLQLGEVKLDVAEAARLALPEQPGDISRVDEFLVWQPYQGVDVYGGLCPADLHGDPFIARAEERLFPRGMARTVRFSCSLSDRSPRVVRYLAPAWWYGVCEEFSPRPLLPVSNSYDATTQKAREWALEYVVQRGFEDGSLPRHSGGCTPREGDLRKRHEPGWEGEVPYAQFLGAWRSGHAEDYDAAMRSAYAFTDVAVDHAMKQVRMHGYASPGFSVPMNRVQGCVAAYLETGNPYLLETAQAVTETAYWTNRNSWPRMAVGRDACFIRSAVLIYRYFGIDWFRQMAFNAGLAVIHSQRENGSFGDQGGGTGLHSFAAYITKPWMGLMALNGVVDYLELFPDEEQFAAAVRKFADWLMAERYDHDGIVTWSYQHDYNGKRRYYDPFSQREVDLPSPAQWHQDNLGRLLGFCALRYDRPEYLAAWAESYRGAPAPVGDHAVAASLQYVPWVQDRLWNATLEEDAIHIRPYHFGDLTPHDGHLLTPDGDKAVRWCTPEKVAAAEGIVIDKA